MEISGGACECRFSATTHPEIQNLLWPRFINRVTYYYATLCDISEKLCPALKALTLVFPIISKVLKRSNALLFLQPVRSNNSGFAPL